MVGEEKGANIRVDSERREGSREGQGRACAPGDPGPGSGGERPIARTLDLKATGWLGLVAHSEHRQALAQWHRLFLQAFVRASHRSLDRRSGPL